MAGGDLTGLQRKRLNPYKGLVIDVPKWVDAHSYHSDQQRLHALSLHRPGVVFGLEAVAWNPPDSSVVIYPGVALDHEGNMIVVPEVQRFQLKAGEKGTTHIVLRYSEVGQDVAEVPGESKTQPLYILEAFRIEEMRQPPGETDIELARVVTGSKSGAIKDAADSLNPGTNEIDLNFRRLAGPRAQGSITMALLDIPGWMHHRDGVMSLVRYVNQSTNFRAFFGGAVGLTGPIAECDLLCMVSGEKFEFGEEEEKVLAGFLGRGGVLLGEACGEGGEGGKEGGKAFRQAFSGLSQSLGRTLKTVERGHPLLKVHHVFSGAPAGVDGPVLLMEDDGVAHSDGDYGCLWNGGRSDKAMDRQSIRDALELGTNFAVYAHNRTRAQALKLAAA
jgi:hypothetical protein